eukprot:2451207-Pyramimonas_sp.AAC.1
MTPRIASQPCWPPPLQPPSARTAARHAAAVAGSSPAIGASACGYDHVHLAMLADLSEAMQANMCIISVATASWHATAGCATDSCPRSSGSNST